MITSFTYKFVSVLRLHKLNMRRKMRRNEVKYEETQDINEKA